MKYMNDHIPSYLGVTIGTLIVSFLLDIMLLTAGIGLLGVKPWARRLSLVYAPLSILYHLANFLYSLLLVMPATDKMYAQYPALAGMSSIMTAASGIGVFLTLLLIVYPITVLVILLLPSTAAAFRGEVPVDADDLREEELDEDERGREPPSDRFRRA